MDYRGPAKRCRILDRKAGVFRPPSIAKCVRTVRQARPRLRLDDVAKLLLAPMARIFLLHDALARTRRPVQAFAACEAAIIPRPWILSKLPRQKSWNGKEAGQPFYLSPDRGTVTIAPSAVVRWQTGTFSLFWRAQTVP